MHGLQEICGDNVRWAMLESGPLPEPALTALAPQDASCPPHACIASSTPYVEEREALTKSRSNSANNEYSLLVLYKGKNTFIRRHVGRRPSWSTCHAQNYPGLPRLYRRPNLSHCKLFRRRNHHDFVEFRFFKKTYCTRNTATTREDWTALYHVISLKPTRPN